MSWKDKVIDGFSYPLTIESKKRKQTLVMVEAPFEPKNNRKGLLEKKPDGRTVLSVPEGGGTFVVYEAEDSKPECECVLLFDGSRFWLKQVTREVRAKRELKEDDEEEEVEEVVFDDEAGEDDGEIEFENLEDDLEDEAVNEMNFD